MVSSDRILICYRAQEGLVRTLLRAAGFVVVLGLIAVAANLWTSRASTPLLVQVTNAPSPAAPPFVEGGRCYFIELTT